MRKFFAFLIIVFFVFTASCLLKRKTETFPALSLFNEGLKEKQLAGPLGRFGWLKSWFIQEVDYNEPGKQILITTCFETTDYFILVKHDFRFTNLEWVEFGAVKIDTIDKVDIEQPYRFWLRRFFFSGSH